MTRLDVSIESFVKTEQDEKEAIRKHKEAKQELLDSIFDSGRTDLLQLNMVRVRREFSLY